MFPKGERAHPTTKPSGQQGSDVPRRGTSPSHNKTFRSTRKRCFPKGNKLEPTLRQACFMVCCSFRPLEVRRHLVNALPKGAVNLVPLRTSTSGSVSERTTYLHHDLTLHPIYSLLWFPVGKPCLLGVVFLLTYWQKPTNSPYSICFVCQ